jgi:hypothetical protein
MASLQHGRTTGLVLALIMVLAGSAAAHMGNRIFQIWELPTADLPDLHDDTLDDWEEDFPGLPLDYHDFTSIVVRAQEPDDLAFRVFLAWHNASQSLYIAVECLDNQLISEGDLLGVRVDGDHSGGLFGYYGGEYAEEERKRFHQSQAQSYLIYEYSPEGIRLRHSGAAASWVTQPPWGDAGGFQIGEAPSHAVVELMITPWDDLNGAGPEQSRRSELKGGKIIGLNLLVNDIDEPAHGDPPSYEIKNWYELAPLDPNDTTHGGSASGFADAVLVPCKVGDCSEAPGRTTAVRPDSWARIKASFR